MSDTAAAASVGGHLTYDVAGSIADKLCSAAEWSGDACSWSVTLDSPPGGGARACGPALYYGTAGIGLFLAAAHRRLGERRYADIARGAARAAATGHATLPAGFRASLYTGAVGIGYALARCGEDLDDPLLVAEGLRLADRSTRGLRGSRMDLMTGLAGAIAALLELAPLARGSWPVDRARKLAAELVGRARPRERGKSWSEPPIPPFVQWDDPIGLGHGTAGVAWALAGVHLATGEQRWLEAAIEALHYEAGWFDEKRGGWPRLSPLVALPPSADELPHPCQWCHGTAGSAIAFRALAGLADDDELARLADQAVRSTEAQTRAYLGDTKACNYSLCHGVAGNADLLRVARTLAGDGPRDELPAEVADVGARRHLADANWPSGEPGTAQVTGLMTGVAGTGLFYLSVQDPSLRSPLAPGPYLEWPSARASSLVVRT